MPETADALTRRKSAIADFADRLWNADDKTLRWVLGVLVIILACFNFLRDLNNPNHAFWDESYYLTTTQRYVEGRAQYASHPPLGFMFMAAGVKTLGGDKELNTHSLGDLKKIDSRTLVAGYDFTGIRLPAALFSVVGALLFYLIMLRMSAEAFDAFVFSLLFVFENAFIVHFRAAHLDPYQLTFTLGSILVWLSTFAKEPKRPLLTYALFGALCGLSFMVKVNSLIMLGLGALSLARAVWFEPNKENITRQLARGGAIAAAFAFVVATVFTLHVVFNPESPNPNAPAGQRDLRAMGQTYKDYLNHKRPLSPAVVIDATVSYYKYMKHDFVYEIKTEANGSQAILWPLMNKTISYRWDYNGKKTSYVQMVGNPVNWGLGIVGVVAALALILRRRAAKESSLDRDDMDLIEPLFAMYMVFWWFHVWLGTQRVMYIYHYFIGLSLSFFLVALSFKIISRRVPFIAKHRFTILCALSLAIAGSYLFYSPLTYHYPMSKAECALRNVPVEVVVCQPIKKKKPEALAPSAPPAATPSLSASK